MAKPRNNPWAGLSPEAKAERVAKMLKARAKFAKQPVIVRPKEIEVSTIHPQAQPQSNVDMLAALIVAVAKQIIKEPR